MPRREPAAAEAYLPLCDDRVGASVAVVDALGECCTALRRMGNLS